MAPTNNADNVAERIRKISRAARISQESLAAAIGLSQQAMSRRFQGEVDFSVSELTAIAPLLGTTAAALLTPTASPSDAPSAQGPGGEAFSLGGAA